MRHHVILCFCTAVILIVKANIVLAVGETAEQKQQQIVQQYIQEFNAQDTEAMLKMVTSDVQWLSIDGETIAKESNSKEELRIGMQSYFESCRSCRSRLAGMFSTGSRVSAVEIASYQTSSGKKEQSSVSVYEFSGDLIKRVYYFPSDN